MIILYIVSRSRGVAKATEDNLICSELVRSILASSHTSPRDNTQQQALLENLIPK